MTTLNDVFEKYIRVKSISKMNATVKQYRSIVGAMVTAIGSRRDIYEISDDDMIDYVIDELQGRDTRYVDELQKPEQVGGLSPESIRTHIRVLKAFWAWVAKIYRIPNPMDVIDMPKKPDTGIRAMKHHVFRSIFEATEDTKTGVRDRAMLALLADSGGRPIAIFNMRLLNVDVLHRQCKTIDKGNVQHFLHWSPIANSFLETYLQERIRVTTNSDDLWLNIDGNPLTYSGLVQRMTQLAKKADVSHERTNLYSIRHSTAQSFAESGMNQAILKRLLGHSPNSNVAEIYYQKFREQALREAQAKHSPMRNLLGD